MTRRQLDTYAKALLSDRSVQAAILAILKGHRHE